jgi:WRKY transcription factor 22
MQTGNISSDLWAWKKYGQKSIKGSPYPRLVFKVNIYRDFL